jgi:VanZ family protein
LAGILAVVIILLIYGTLYPWVFVARDLPASPLYILVHTWAVDLSQPLKLFDIALNLAIYMPLGTFAYLTFRRIPSRALRALTPVVLGALLSGTLEMTQLFVPSRQCSAVDWFANTLGTALGVAAGFAFRRIVPATHSRDRGALALLVCGVAYLTFPLFPILHRDEISARALAYMQPSLISPVAVLSALAGWFAAGQMLLCVGVRRPLVWLSLLLCLLPLQVAIMGRTPTLASLAGGLLALLLFSFGGRMPQAARASAILVLLAIVIEGLSPFSFAAPQPFVWIPFSGLMNTPQQIAFIIVLRKLFLYGTAVWLLHICGLSFVRAGTAVSILLAAIELLQTRIPPHVPEITDPLLAVLCSFALSTLARHRAKPALGAR